MEKQLYVTLTNTETGDELVIRSPIDQDDEAILRDLEETTDFGKLNPTTFAMNLIAERLDIHVKID